MATDKPLSSKLCSWRRGEQRPGGAEHPLYGHTACLGQGPTSRSLAPASATLLPLLLCYKQILMKIKEGNSDASSGQRKTCWLLAGRCGAVGCVVAPRRAGRNPQPKAGLQCHRAGLGAATFTSVFSVPFSVLREQSQLMPAEAGSTLCTRVGDP